MEQLVLALLTSAGVSVALTAALVWLSKTWISERVKGAIQHEYEQKIEAYKAELKAQSEVALERLKASHAQFLALHDSASNTVSTIHGIAHERRLKAVEAIWGAIVATKKETPVGVIAADAFAENDYDRLFFRTEQLRGFISGINFDAVKRLGAVYNPLEIENCRPFAGEYLFALFEAYRTLTIRVVVITAMGLSKGKVEAWYRDEWNESLISKILSTAEMAAFKASELKFNFIRVALEQKIIEQSSRTISGEASAAYMLQQGTHILDFVRTMEALNAGRNVPAQ